MTKFVGDRKIKSTTTLEEKTPGGTALIRVDYANGETEVLSKLMFDHVVRKQSIDATALRELRLAKLIEQTLALCREWGIKIGETPYYGQMLNHFLNYNITEAELILWGEWTQKPRERDDVSLIDVDRVLRSARPTLKEVIGEDGAKQ